MRCSVHETQGIKPHLKGSYLMDLTNTLWLDSVINDGLREGGYRRDRIKRTWIGYSSEFSDTTGSDQKAWDDIRRRERMAEAMYEV